MSPFFFHKLSHSAPSLYTLLWMERLRNSRDAWILAIPVEAIKSFYPNRGRFESKTHPSTSAFAGCRGWRWQTWWWWWYYLVSKMSVMDQRICSTDRWRYTKIRWRWSCLISKLIPVTLLKWKITIKLENYCRKRQ